MPHEEIAELLAAGIDVDAEGRFTVTDSEAAARWAVVSKRPTTTPAPNTNCEGCNTVAGCGGFNEICGPVNVAKGCGGKVSQ